MLADEHISGDEIIEMYAAFQQCLAEQGITLIGYGEGGGFSTESGLMGEEKFIVRLDFCRTATGEPYIELLHREENREISP